MEHVPKSAGCIIIPGSVLDTDRLGDGDLDMIDVIAVPDRLEDRVRKSQHEDVLNGFLAEVMIDSIDLGFAEVAADTIVQFNGTLKVSAERFFKDEFNLFLLAGDTRGSQPRRAQMLDDRRIQKRWNGQVKNDASMNMMHSL